jgi:uroporphyrinogen-III synthase
VTLRVAVTRALPEAEATASRLREIGAEAVLAPLLSIEPRAFDATLDGVQALLFTSTNGVRAFCAATSARDVRVLTVGDATAAAARQAGFADVRSADGDVAALAALAMNSLAPASGNLLHISGAHAAGDLIGALASAGFNAERRVAYEARAAPVLPEAFSGPLDVVLFHSPRAAETFVRLGAPGAERLTAVCISPAAARAAAGAAWKRVIVSQAPREDALLRAVAAG